LCCFGRFSQDLDRCVPRSPLSTLFVAGLACLRRRWPSASRSIPNFQTSVPRDLFPFQLLDLRTPTCVGPREVRRKSGFEGREAGTGKDLWGQKSESSGSIETLRASGAGDMQVRRRTRSRVETGERTGQGPGKNARSSTTRRRGHGYLTGLITSQAIADHQSEQTLEVDVPGAGAIARW